MAEWNESLEGIDTSADLAGDPQITSSEEGFQVIFQIQPGSRLWRDWAVALVTSIRNHLEPDSFVGFYDAVAGRMHAAGREDPFDETE